MTDKNALCETCGSNSVNCVGHYAYIKLVVPVFHIGYFKHTIAVLQAICKVCTFYDCSVDSDIMLCSYRLAPVCYWTNLTGDYIYGVSAEQTLKMSKDKHSQRLSIQWLGKSCIVHIVLQPTVP